MVKQGKAATLWNLITFLFFAKFVVTFYYFSLQLLGSQKCACPQTSYKSLKDLLIHFSRQFFDQKFWKISETHVTRLGQIITWQSAIYLDFLLHCLLFMINPHDFTFHYLWKKSTFYYQYIALNFHYLWLKSIFGMNKVYTSIPVWVKVKHR